MNDQSIVSLFLERSETAIKATAEKYGRYLLSVAMGVLSSLPDSEECVNDTYARLWDNIPPHEPASLGAFAARITRNLALNRLAHYGAQKRIGQTATVVLEEIAEIVPDGTEDIDTQLRETINAFLEGLDRRARVVFMQRYWYTRSIREISRSTGMSENAVKSQLARTRKSLRDYLEKNGVNV